MWPTPVLVLVLVAACGFEIGAAGGDGPDAVGGDGGGGGGGDADAPPADAVADAFTVAPGHATPTMAAMPGTALGGTGGSSVGDLACAATELPIGLQFDVTSATISNHANQLLLVNVHVRCGRVERLSNGSWQTTPAGQVTHLGNNGTTATSCNPYFPTTPSLDAQCASGSVLVGVVGNQVDSTLYNTVSILCAPLALDGSVTATSTTVAVTGSGSYNNQPEMTTCPAGRAIITMTARSGCAQDGLTPACAPLTFVP